MHQHGGADRPAHPPVHALLSPRFEDRSPTHLSPRTITRVRERWEREVLRELERQERRIEHARNERTPVQALTPYRPQDRVRQLPLMPAKTPPRRPLACSLNAFTRDPERAARRMTFRLATGLVPKPIREALWVELMGIEPMTS